jgi:ribose transport system permease protein
MRTCNGSNPRSSPRRLTAGSARFSGGAPVSFIFGAGVALMLWLAMRWTPFGRYVQAIGLGETAALLSGVSVGTVKVVASAVSGFLAGLTGMALVARTYSGNPSAASSLLLPSIAAVVVGGRR